MADNIKSIETLSDLLPDHANANKGNDRGNAMLRVSLERNGAGRSVLADRNGRLIAGNKTVEAAKSAHLPIRVIQTDGNELVVVQRTDLDLTDARGKARELAFADNRVGEVNLEWDGNAIMDFANDFPDVSLYFSKDELNQLFRKATKDIAAAIEPPKPDAQDGQTKAVSDVMDEWENAGMPEYVNSDKSPWHSVKVNFASQEDLDEFNRLLQTRVTPKSTFTWYPRRDNEDNEQFRWVADGEDE